MAIVFYKKYKEVVKKVQTYDLDQFTKAVCVLEELDGHEDIDYATMVKGVLETYLQEEINIPEEK